MHDFAPGVDALGSHAPVAAGHCVFLPAAGVGLVPCTGL